MSHRSLFTSLLVGRFANFHTNLRSTKEWRALFRYGLRSGETEHLWVRQSIGDLGRFAAAPNSPKVSREGGGYLLRGKPDTRKRTAHNQGAESHRGRLNFSSRRVRFIAQGKKRREVEAGRKPSLESSELDRDDTPVLLIKVCCLQPASGCIRAQVQGARGWRR